MSDSLPPSTHRILKALSNQIYRSSKSPIVNAAGHGILWGTVISIQTGPPETLTIQVMGASANISSVSYLSGYMPTVNDYVMMSKAGTDLVVLGSIGGNKVPSGFAYPHSFGLTGTISASTSIPIPPFFVPSLGSQNNFITGCGLVLGAGTCTVDIQDNGVTVPSAGGLAVTTTPSTVTVSPIYSVAPNHQLSINVTVPSGATTLTVTLFIRTGS